MDSSLASRSLMLTMTLVIEGLLLLGAAGWIFFGNIPLAPFLIPSQKAIFLGVLTGAGTATISWLIYLSGKYIKLFAGLRRFSKDFLAPMVTSLTLVDILVMSLVSGFCEEVLFRGIIQRESNIFCASLVFGIFHDPSFRHLSFVLAATIAGAIMGLLYLQTENLWAPITAHAVHNAISLLILRYFSKTKLDT